MDPNLLAVVGMGVLRRNGTIVRAFTGTMVDVNGLVVTANHNIDRLKPGDTIVVAVPDARSGAIPVIMAPLGTYPGALCC